MWSEKIDSGCLKKVIIPHNSEVGEKLTKTKEQLMPMAQFPFGDDHEETKEQPMGE